VRATQTMPRAACLSLVEMVAWNCRRFGGADALLVEAKPNGLDVINEMQRLYGLRSTLR